ncbi:MAG TPA: zinc ribbon domain-containing protein [Pyrinomonadaceae bacterium]|nr:zinc ribbon domain-containing protein [Pyrinomonadaceae bacterium]
MLTAMYCPHCGVQNAQETKFCRGCGEDLRLVSQAVTKSLPLIIAHRVDEVIDRGRGGWRSYQLFRAEHRRAFGQILMGLSSLFVIVWFLVLGHGDVSFASGFLFVVTLALLLTSVHELWAKKHGERETQGPGELPPSFSTRELPESREPVASSVTEATTTRLKVGARRETLEDELK